MAETPLSTGIGQGAAQVWQSNLTNQAFQDLVKQKRLDDAAQAERERQDQLIADKRAEERRKLIYAELKDAIPDMSKIWEFRDGGELRAYSQKKFNELMSDPNFAKNLISMEDEGKAFGQLKAVKAELASMINKSIQDKADVKASGNEDIADQYLAAKNNGEDFYSDKWDEDTVGDYATFITTPLGGGMDVRVPGLIEKVDVESAWMDYVKAENEFNKQQYLGKAYDKTDAEGAKLRVSGWRRDDDYRQGMLDEFFEQDKFKKAAFKKLGLDWNNRDNLSDPEQKVWTDYLKDKYDRDTALDFKNIAEAEAPIKKGTEEEQLAYNRIDEMTKVLQTQGGTVVRDANAPEYQAYTYDDDGKVMSDFYEGGLLEGYAIYVPKTDQGKNVLSVLSSGKYKGKDVKAANLVQPTTGGGQKAYAILTDDGVDLVSTDDYAALAKVLSYSEGVKNWSLQNQDAMNKTKSGAGSVTIGSTYQLPD
jgi:hypothetical protein